MEQQLGSQAKTDKDEEKFRLYSATAFSGRSRKKLFELKMMRSDIP